MADERVEVEKCEAGKPGKRDGERKGDIML
jgi:hypothetical protein